MFIIDGGLVLALLGVFGSHSQEIHECSNNLWLSGVLIFSYLVFFAVRDVTTLLCMLPC